MGKDYAIKIVNPIDVEGPKIEAIIPYRLTLNYYKFHPVRYENLRAAKFVLENPKRIFTGLRAFNEGGWCFTGKPVSWYIRETVEKPFPDDLIFAVYLNPRFYVFECRAEKVASDDPYCPEDWENRYKALIWKSTS